MLPPDQGTWDMLSTPPAMIRIAHAGHDLLRGAGDGLQAAGAEAVDRLAAD
ncbi:MAG: hypothetical protein R2838_07365 [Caldilineaceae bacterium]